MTGMQENAVVKENSQSVQMDQMYEIVKQLQDKVSMLEHQSNNAVTSQVARVENVVQNSRRTAKNVRNGDEDRRMNAMHGMLSHTDIGDIKRGDYDEVVLTPPWYERRQNEGAMCMMVNTYTNAMVNELNIKHEMSADAYTDDMLKHVHQFFRYIGIEEGYIGEMKPDETLDVLLFTNMTAYNTKISQLFDNSIVALNSNYVAMMLCRVSHLSATGDLKCVKHGCVLTSRRVIVRFEESKAKMANVMLMTGEYTAKCKKCIRLMFVYVLLTCWNGHSKIEGSDEYERFMDYLTLYCNVEKVKYARSDDMLNSIITSVSMMQVYYKTGIMKLSAVGVSNSYRAHGVMKSKNVQCDVAKATKILSLLVASERNDMFKLLTVKYADSKSNKLVLASKREIMELTHTSDDTYFESHLLHVFVLHRCLFNRLGVTDYSLVQYDTSRANAVVVDTRIKMPKIGRINNAVNDTIGNVTVKKVTRCRQQPSPTVTMDIRIGNRDGKIELEDEEIDVLKRKLAELIAPSKGTIVNEGEVGDRRIRYKYLDYAYISQQEVYSTLKIMADQRSYNASSLYKILKKAMEKTLASRELQPGVSAEISVDVPVDEQSMKRYKITTAKLL